MSIFRRIANLLHRSRVDRDIDAELQTHIALRTEDNVSDGMSPEEARRDALVRFGNRTVTKERVTAADAALWTSSIGSDIRYASRQLVKNPSFALAAILSLALGIGATVRSSASSTAFFFISFHTRTSSDWPISASVTHAAISSMLGSRGNSFANCGACTPSTASPPGTRGT